MEVKAQDSLSIDNLLLKGRTGAFDQLKTRLIRHRPQTLGKIVIGQRLLIRQLSGQAGNEDEREEKGKEFDSRRSGKGCFRERSFDHCG